MRGRPTKAVLLKPAGEDERRHGAGRKAQPWAQRAEEEPRATEDEPGRGGGGEQLGGERQPVHRAQHQRGQRHVEHEGVEDRRRLLREAAAAPGDGTEEETGGQQADELAHEDRLPEEREAGT